MKRIFAVFSVVLLMVIALPMTARADVGPKPSITVNCVNLPKGEAYLDLLIDDAPFENEGGFRYGAYEWGEAPDYYDSEMLAVLKAYNVDGWRPALVTGTRAPMWGELRLENRDGLYESSFGYMGVPDRFKVIVVTKGGGVAVSNIIEKKAFDCYVTFDYATGKAVERNAAARTAARSVFTLIATLIIEGLLLLLFRFSLKQNWKPFLFVNLGTQIFLNAAVALASMWLGTELAALVYVLCEILIVIAETILFVFLLKQHSKLRRALYAVTANIVSFAAGIIVMIIAYGI